MPQLVEYPLESGGVVLIEGGADSLAAGAPTLRGLRPDADVSTRAAHTFEEALGGVAPVAAALIAHVRGLVDSPDEAEFVFGLKFNAECGAIIAKASGEATVEVTLRWAKAASSET